MEFCGPAVGAIMRRHTVPSDFHIFRTFRLVHINDETPILALAVRLPVDILTSHSNDIYPHRIKRPRFGLR